MEKDIESAQRALGFALPGGLDGVLQLVEADPLLLFRPRVDIQLVAGNSQDGLRLVNSLL